MKEGVNNWLILRKGWSRCEGEGKGGREKRRGSVKRI